jgi:hypothetical protein
LELFVDVSNDLFDSINNIVLNNWNLFLLHLSNVSIFVCLYFLLGKLIINFLDESSI